MSALPMSCLVVFYLYVLSLKGEFYSCPIVTTHTNYWNNSIINRNRYSCQSIHCSYISASYRSKYVCNEWPFYTGFFPQWMKSSNSFQCKNNTQNNHCSEWNDNNKNKCFCKKSNRNNIYCAHWICIQYDDDNDNDSFKEEIISKCNETESNEDIYCPSNINDNIFSNCWCKLESHTNNFCQRWYCEYYKQRIHDDHVHLSIEETEWQKCISLYSTINITKYGNYNNTLCWKWIGDIINHNQWTVNQCICNIPSSLNRLNNNAFCNEWNCTQIGMKYFAASSNEIGLFWIWFAVFDIICAFITCSYCGVITNKYRKNWKNIKLKKKYKTYIMLLCITNIIILPLITLFIGGFINFLFFIITSILSFCIGYLCLKNCWFCFFCNNDINDAIFDGDQFNEYKYKYNETELRHLAKINNNNNNNNNNNLNTDNKSDYDSNSNNNNNQWINPDGKIKRIDQNECEYDDETNTTIMTSTMITTNATVGTTEIYHLKL